MARRQRRGAAVSAGVGTASGSGWVDSIVALVRSYFSTQHLYGARHFARLAAQYEADHLGETRLSPQHRAYVMGSIMESAAFVEAYINEIYQDAAEGQPSAISGLAPEVVEKLATYWADHQKMQTLAKYRMARSLAGAPPADRGARPYDDVVYLIKLRNWLLRYRPKSLGETNPEKVIDHIRDRFAPSPLLSGDGGASWFPNHALSAGCAEWAVASSVAFVEEFVTAIGCTRPHHRLEHDERP